MTRTNAGLNRQPVVILTRPAAGGIRSHILQLLRYLNREQFDVSLAAPKEFLAALPPNESQTYKVIPVEVAPRLSFSDFRAAQRLATLADGSRALVHAHGIRAALIAALAKLTGSRFPLVVTYHNVPPRTQLSRLALGLIARHADAQITVSRAIAVAIPDGNGTDVIPNGIDLSQFASIEQKHARALLDLPDGSHSVVGAVARLSPEKGIDVLLAAARLTPQIRYIIAGDGPEAAQLRKDAPSNVRFLGYVPDPRTVYAASDIVAIPSRSEGQGIVALEAMASGTPVIASDVGGLAETISSGSTGILVEPGNAPKLAEAIQSLLEDPSKRAALSHAALRWLRAQGDVQARVAEVEAIYRRVWQIGKLH